MDPVSYVEHANLVLRKQIARWPQFVAFGQNIDAGSRLGGLTRGLSDIAGMRIINSPNCENAMVGMGMGLSIEGMPSALILKQQDFLLLGIDQLFNTANALRERAVEVPFVIVAIVVDSGWEGPQSSFNDTYGIGTLCRVPIFTPVTASEISESFRKAFGGGHSFVALSQRLFRQPVWRSPEGYREAVEDGYTEFRSADTSDPTKPAVVSLNFALPQASNLIRDAASIEKPNVLFNVWNPSSATFHQVIRKATASRSVTIVDDAKSIRTAGQDLYGMFLASGYQGKLNLVVRSDVNDWHLPARDTLEIG